jgi:SET domain-containing protein
MPAKAAASKTQRRIQVRKSGVHGKGVFALQDIPEGETLIEYVGEIITWKEAQRRHPWNPAEPNHTFYFHVDDKRVIDAAVGGNAARWINHSCEPNCEADEEEGRIFIKSLRNIKAGEELSYDYGLIIDEPYTKKLKAEYPCWCGSSNCRGTLLAPKRRK